MATTLRYHPKQPDKKLGVNDLNLPEKKEVTEQKHKKLGEQEWDLTSFQNEPWKSPAKMRKGGKQVTK